MMQYTKWNKTVFFYHVLAWLVYCCIFFLINRLTDPSLRFSSLLGSFIPIVLIFYVALSLFRLYLPKKDYFSLVVFLLLFDGFLLSLTYWYIYRLLPSADIHVYNQDVAYSHQAFVQKGLLVLLRFTLYAFTYYLIEKERASFRKLIQAQEEVYQNMFEKLLVENKLVHAETSLLKQQISPHTLYNMLNGIYYKALANGEKVSTDIVKLGNLVAQYIQPIAQTNGLVVVEKEVNCIRDLIDLCCDPQELPGIEFCVSGQLGSQLIPGMALVGLVENVLKYGVLNEPASPALVTLKLSPYRLEFSTYNKIAYSKQKNESYGVGLKNVQRRLELLLPERARFYVKKQGDHFLVNLSIHY